LRGRRRNSPLEGGRGVLLLDDIPLTPFKGGLKGEGKYAL